MKIGLLPKSKLGKWSASLALAFILIMVALVWLTVSQTLRGAPTVVDPAVLSRILKTFLAAIAAGALATGVLSMIKSRERSAVTFVSIAIGFFGLVGALS